MCDFTHRLFKGLNQECIPKWIFRRRGRDYNRSLFYRMCKFNFSCMKMNTCVVVGSFASVFNVSFNWTTQLRKCCTDLMMSSCFRIYFDKRVMVAFSKDFVGQFRFFSVGSRFVIKERFVLLFMCIFVLL